MIHQNSLQFLIDLASNNNKEWFDANRKRYESAKNDFLSLTTEVLSETAKFDPTISHLTAKECIFRINRDVRFSSNKDPYKTNMGISITKGGRKNNLAGYYFHLEPSGQSFAGGGLYMAAPDELKKIRQEIDYCGEEFLEIIQSTKFSACYGDLSITPEFSLVRPPKGYEEDNPMIKYLKLKSFVASVPFANEALTAPTLVAKIANCFQALHPLIAFINRAIEQ